MCADDYDDDMHFFPNLLLLMMIIFPNLIASLIDALFKGKILSGSDVQV